MLVHLYILLLHLALYRSYLSLLVLGITTGSLLRSDLDLDLQNPILVLIVPGSCTGVLGPLPIRYH